ncbi:hypothetical protein C8Q74DRAFT_1028961 [Fomes fomentarius]|nr:hypothetical protein C8Q74DRAFT_1028961 [Fomes fomentarius]
MKFSPVIAGNLAILEIFSTLPDEVEYIWPGRVTPTKALFFANRYLPLIDITIAVIINAAPTHWNHDNCAIAFQALAYCYTAGILVSEVILIIRTLALWGFHKYVKIVCFGVLIEFGLFAIYAVYHTVYWLEYPSDETLYITGCVPVIRDGGMWPAFFCFLMGETVVISLTILKRVKDCEDGLVVPTRKLTWTMYRDGSFFYAIILAISIANMIAVHSSLCTHVLLNLRKAARTTGDTGTDEFSMQAHMVFALDPAIPNGLALDLDDC